MREFGAKKPISLSLLHHLPFYLISILLGLGISAYFVWNSAAGPRWALEGLPLDDAWIHTVYARNLAENGWFYYNPGVPEAGMSSPLWVILLAGMLKLGFQPSVAAKSLSILFGLAVPIVLYHASLLMSEDRLVAWLAGLLVAIEPNFSFARVSGMEVTLVAFLVCLFLWFYLKGNYLAFGLSLGFAIIARGEVAIIGIISGGIAFLAQYLRRDELTLLPQKEIRLVLELSLPSLILGGAWTLYNISISGNPLPNTYYVKHNFGLGLFNSRNLYNIWMGYLRHAVISRMWLAPLTLFLVSYGCLHLVRKQGIRIIPWLLAPFVFIYLLSVNLAMSPAEWNFMGRRHLDFIWPLILVPAIFGALTAWKKSMDGHSWRRFTTLHQSATPFLADRIWSCISS